jgi:hypothetical protein
MSSMKTYGDIISAVMEAIGAQASDNTAKNKVKRFINMVYLDEVVPAKRWRWLEQQTSIVHKEYHSVGTMSVTPGSATITFGTAPNVSLGSFKGYRFAVEGFDEVYTISSHTAASTSATLTSPYQGTVNAVAVYKIWRDRVDLPTDAKETVGIQHSKRGTEVKALGWQEFRQAEIANPKQEGYPVYSNTTDFFDPSADSDELESDRYRQVRIWPSISLNPVTLNIDYIVEPTELEDDDDEPVLPIGDRIVIYDGALSHAWSKISRDEEMADKELAKFSAKMSRMMGEIEDGFDKPVVAPRGNYINNIRGSGLRRKRVGLPSGGGSSNYASPTYAKNIIIEGGNLTANLTANPGVTIDGVDISELDTIVDGLVNPEEVTLDDNTAVAAIAAAFDITISDVVYMQYSISRGAGFEAGVITMLTDGVSAAAFAQGSMALLGDPCGITFSVALEDGELRLKYVSTSTGDDAVFKYRTFRWLS